MSTLTAERSIGPSHSGDGAVYAKAADENFPVALRLLPRRYRQHLVAIYGFARLVDDTGDEPGATTEERLERLDALEAELDRAVSESASDPVFRRLGATIRACELARQPFVDLLEANRLDQRQDRYETFEDLLGYCRLSADPVGRLVLGVFGQPGAERERRSDLVCSALQVIEHLQDVVEDAGRGRVYIPLEDWARFSLDPSILTEWNGLPEGRRPPAPPALRRLVAFEAARARSLLEEGSTLLRLLDRRPAAVAVAGYVGGGFAQLDAIESSSYDVLSTTVKAPRSQVGMWAARLLLSRRRI